VIRIVLGFCVLFCLAIVGLGVHLVLEQQRYVTSFSAQTTATVLEKRLQQHRNSRNSEIRITYEPVVKFQFHAQGRRVTSENVFSHDFRVGGNLGRIVAEAPLDKFKVGQKTRAYYHPDNPEVACLIRRPSSLLYLVILLPVMVVSGLFAYFWRSSQRRGVEFKRWKAWWITTIWHTAGLASIGHYFCLAGTDYAGEALILFGVYTLLGMIPVTFVLPPEIAKRVSASLWGSMFGIFIGFWIGLIVGWLAGVFSASATFRLQCVGYGMVIPAGLFGLLGLLGKSKGGVSNSETKRKAPLPKGQPWWKSDNHVPKPPPDGHIPYDIDQRPMPAGEDMERLLPAQIGAFRRQAMNIPNDTRNTIIEAQYHSDYGVTDGIDHGISFTIGIYDHPAGVQEAIDIAHVEVCSGIENSDIQLSLKTEPSFFKVNRPTDAFMAWTRGGYYFSAHARSGDDDLDRFMEAFPY